VAATVAGAISYIAQIGYWSLFGGGDNRKGEGNVLGLILIVIFAPLAALLVRLAISRGLEYKADRTGVLITKKPHNLATALRKISESAAAHPIKGSSATSHMWIVSPFTSDWFTSMFSTHPPIESRIARLEEMSI
jgi:heat shock protein HtpX